MHAHTSRSPSQLLGPTVSPAETQDPLVPLWPAPLMVSPRQHRPTLGSQATPPTHWLVRLELREGSLTCTPTLDLVAAPQTHRTSHPWSDCSGCAQTPLHTCTQSRKQPLPTEGSYKWSLTPIMCLVTLLSSMEALESCCYGLHRMTITPGPQR